MQISAQLQNAKVLLQFLKVVNFKDDVNIVLSSNGMKLTVQESSVFQANAFLQKDVFRYFNFPPEAEHSNLEAEQEFVFRVQLSSMIDCLSLFSGSASSQPVLCFKYVEDEALQMWMEESGVIVEINAKIKAPLQSVDFEFAKSDLCAKIILNSEHIKDTLADLDGTSETVQVKVCPVKKHLSLLTKSTLGEGGLMIPSDSELVGHFEADQLVSTRYKMHLFKIALKPLPIAEKVSLRIDKNDLLCIQYMVKVEEQKCFLEYLCLPEVE